MHYKNALGSDGGNIEKHVMTKLSNQDSDDPYFQEQAVLATLWLKDQPKFWKHLAQYVRLHPHDHMPRIFQEAAYLFGTLEHRTNLDQMPFDESVKKTYQAFSEQAEKYDDQPIEVVRTALSPFFGNTYFFEYYLYNDVTD